MTVSNKELKELIAELAGSILKLAEEIRKISANTEFIIEMLSAP